MTNDKQEDPADTNLGPVLATAHYVENGEAKSIPLRGKPPYDELVTTDDQP